MFYAKYLAPDLDVYTDEATGLTYYPDGSIVDVMGAHHYPTDDLYDSYADADICTLDVLLDTDALAQKL